MKNSTLTRFILAIAFTLCLSAAHAQQENRLPKWAFGGFVRPQGLNPVIVPDSTTVFRDPMTNKEVKWEANDTFNPAATVHKGKIVVLYRGEDKTGIQIGKRTSRIGYASSEDGIHYIRRSKPVLYPDEDAQKEFEWPGGCEDGRAAVTEDGLHIIFYTQWNRQVPRIAVATSRDLINWKKHGPIFQDAYKGRFLSMATKSASILTRIKGDKQVITRLDGEYFMYWGERNVYCAKSKNLLDWTPVLDYKGELLKVASPRDGHFDSDLTECGPPAILTDYGILLLYNGRNRTDDRGDKRFNAGTYSAGQMLFDKKNPLKLIDRLAVPFFRPMEAFEKTGQYASGTVFIEGLAWFKRKWYLYYGCADSKVGVAVYDPEVFSAADPLEN